MIYGNKNHQPILLQIHSYFNNLLKKNLLSRKFNYKKFNNFQTFLSVIVFFLCYFHSLINIREIELGKLTEAVNYLGITFHWDSMDLYMGRNPLEILFTQATL